MLSLTRALRLSVALSHSMACAWFVYVLIAPQVLNALLDISMLAVGCVLLLLLFPYLDLPYNFAIGRDAYGFILLTISRSQEN